MQKKICFSSIFDLTQVQYEQASRLQARGHICYWITTNQKWTTWLLNKNVDRSHILELDPDGLSSLDIKLIDKTLAEIVKIEGDFSRTLNIELMADRFISANRIPNINNLAILYFYYLKSFLIRNSIDLVFGEPTNFNELLTLFVCKSIKIPFITPQDLRIPENRFFFELYGTGQMVSSGSYNLTTSGADLINDYRERKEHPKYFYLLNDNKIKINKVFIKLKNRILSIATKNSHTTHHHLVDRLTGKVAQIISKFYIKYIFKYSKIDELPEKVAFFGLHVQPENSIDVAGPFFSDQLKLIKDIRRSLPFDTALVVKEHPNFLGQKGISFFNKLKNIPNVYVLSPYISTFEIFSKSSLILTVSGTVAYEGGLLNIPTIIFTKQFFNGFSSIHYCPDISMLKALSFRLLGQKPSLDLDADTDFFESIYRYSYEGYWTDPLTDESVMSMENIEALFVGFLDVVERVDLSKF